MTQQVLSSSSDGAVTLSVRMRIEWRYALGLITTAFLLLGASALFGVLLPEHLYIAKWIALVVTFGWLLGVRKLGLFPSGWDRARGSSFSFLQALIEGFAFFVFMLAVRSLGSTRLSLFDYALAAAGGVAIGLYSGTYAPPKQVS